MYGFGKCVLAKLAANPYRIDVAAGIGVLAILDAVCRCQIGYFTIRNL
jgi:hypothetical protein